MNGFFSNFFKGMAMGVANVIPGVSGGTIALITGIFEHLINAIKSFNVKALQLLFKGEWKAFSQHIDLPFLLAVFAGIAASIFTAAKLFDYLFEHYPTYIWSFFFGLILASVVFVGKTINRWQIGTVIVFIVGAGIAIGITLMTPATENQGFLYLMLCGLAAICSMILPGLSGSFVLILMGNYKLVMIDAVNQLRMDILLPVALGAVAGLLAFSHILSWVFKHYKDYTIAVLTGFIFGSLGIIWPWKNAINQSIDGKVKVIGYNYFMPEFNASFLWAFILVVLGFALIWLLENHATKGDNIKK